MNKEAIARYIDGYLRLGWIIYAVRGAAGDDYREIRIELRRPINQPADHAHDEVIGGR